jgi:cytochrome c5
MSHSSSETSCVVFVNAATPAQVAKAESTATYGRKSTTTPEGASIYISRCAYRCRSAPIRAVPYWGKGPQMARRRKTGRELAGVGLPHAHDGRQVSGLDHGLADALQLDKMSYIMENHSPRRQHP